LQWKYKSKRQREGDYEGDAHNEQVHEMLVHPPVISTNQPVFPMDRE
jgi:hypothetical protein